MPENKTPRKLAEEHWTWVEGLLNCRDYDPDLLEEMQYLYITAFTHGYKHAKEE